MLFFLFFSFFFSFSFFWSCNLSIYIEIFNLTILAIIKSPLIELKAKKVTTEF